MSDMEILGIFWQMFYTFFIIGMFTFGGGYAVMSLIQEQVVTVHGWINEGVFADIVGISQMTPGPIGINCATYVGYEVIHNAGASHFISILGSATATLAVVLPSFFIVLALVKFYTRFHTNPVFVGIMGTLRPVVVGLIGSAAVLLIFNIGWGGQGLEMHLLTDNFIDWKSWVLFAGAFVAAYWFKINPILVIIAAGIAGALLF